MCWSWNWTFLLIAIVFETIGTSAMKMSLGFTRFWPSAVMVVCYALCFIFLTLSLKQLDVSLAYAIWSGLGTALITLIGIYYFKESVNALKIISIVFIIAGVIGLNLSGLGHGGEGAKEQQEVSEKIDLRD
jgi:small multidrug resistance pump